MLKCEVVSDIVGSAWSPLPNKEAIKGWIEVARVRIGDAVRPLRPDTLTLYPPDKLALLHPVLLAIRVKQDQTGQKRSMNYIKYTGEGEATRLTGVFRGLLGC